MYNSKRYDGGFTDLFSVYCLKEVYKNNTFLYGVLLYNKKAHKQVGKTFSKNVEGCRDGSTKNHRN